MVLESIVLHLHLHLHLHLLRRRPLFTRVLTYILTLGRSTLLPISIPPLTLLLATTHLVTGAWVDFRFQGDITKVPVHH